MRNLSKQEIINVLLGGGLGIAGAILLTPRDTTISFRNGAAPPDTLDVVVCIVLMALLHLVSGLTVRKAMNKNAVVESQRRVRLRRLAKGSGSRFFRYQAILCLIIFVYLRDESWTAVAIGIKDEMPAITAFACGVIAYALFLLVLNIAYRLFSDVEAQADNSLRTMAMLWPRNPRQKILMAIAICILNPITEEILYRGIIVHQLGLALGGWPLPIALGLLVSLCNHAYQGRRAIATHALYYGFAVALLMSPAGLMGSIGMHFAGDFIPVWAIRRNMHSYRARHRRREVQDELLLVPQVESDSNHYIS